MMPCALWLRQLQKQIEKNKVMYPDAMRKPKK